MTATNLLAAKVMDHIFMGTALSQYTNLYVGLSTTTPAEDGTNFTEPSGFGYARVSTAGADWNTATVADPSVVDNANVITFPAASGGNWGTVTHYGLFSAATLGDLLWTGALTVSKAIDDGDTASFAAGVLDFSAD